jgi:PAS domain S-box-containing protein
MTSVAQSEERFQLLFAGNPLPMWVYDVETLAFLEVNDAAVEHYGYSRDEFLRMHLTDIRPADEHALMKQAVVDAATMADPIRRHGRTWRHRLKDGRLRHVDTASHAIEFAGRRATLVVAIDVTETKEAQASLAKSTQRLEILHEIDRAVIAAESPQAIAETVLARLRGLLGVPRAIVNVFDLEAGEAEWLAAAGRRRIHAGPGVRFSLTLMGDVESLRRGEVQVIDTRALPRSAEVDALLASGVDTYMVVPMIAGGELIGALSFGGASSEFPAEQVGIAREMTAQLAIAIAQTRLREKVSRQAERLSLLHEIDRTIIAAETPEAMATAVLPRLRDLLGVPRAIVNLFDLEAGEVEWLAAVGRHRVRVGPGVRYSLSLAGDLEALKRGEPQVVDIDSLPPGPEVDALRASDVRSYMVVPMLANGELIGSVSFGGAPARFASEQVNIAQEVAAQLAIALTQARLRERVARHTAELEQRVRERTIELTATNDHLQEEMAERKRMEAEADRANRAKSEFLSRMSHELRTPLNGIIGFAQLLELDALSDEQRESVDHILKGGRHLLSLINEVLDIARIESEKLSISLEPVLTAEVVQSAVDLVRPQAAARRVSLLMAGAEMDSRYVLADRQRLQQVLLNILSNAVKYNRDGGTITVSCDERADRVRLTVRDSGYGIAPAMLERLFTPFDRLGAEQTGIEGTGLGLALSKRLVDAMGGALLVESQVGEGTTFGVELPRAENLADPITTADERRNDDAATPKTRGSVLYIEDNVANLRLLERILARRPGLTLLSAMQGRRGLELARDHRPGAIILDLHLPDLPGSEVLKHLREDPQTREIPVVILSADATPGQTARLLAQGAHAYLTKPVDVAQLLALIDELLGGSKG